MVKKMDTARVDTSFNFTAIVETVTNEPVKINMFFVGVLWNEPATALN